MAKCPHCGAEYQFNAKTQLIHCEYCGSDFNPNEVQEKKKVSKKENDLLSGACYRCTQCGATLMTFDETAVTFCSYCGSQNMIEDKITNQRQPDFIIPFSKTQEECVKNYKKKVSSFLFAPSYMKDSLLLQKFRGIYMPYGIYKLTYQGDVVNKGQKYNHRSGDYVYYDDYAIHADVDATYDGISFDLSSMYYDEYSHAIPFNFKEAIPFNTNYLPGFYADAKDVEIGVYSDNAISIGSNDSSRFLLKNPTFRKYSCHSPKVPFHVGEKRVGMFPVYFLSFYNKKKDKIHYAVVNGQTGKVAADLPIDFKKYLIFSLLLAIPIYFGLLVIPVVIPSAINVFAIFTCIVSFLIFMIQLNACNRKEIHENDEGYLSINREEKMNAKKKKKSMPSMKIGYWFKYLMAFLIPLFIIITHPVSDYYYYGSSIISLILVLSSFFDLIKLHNRLVSNPIPQLEKRGGE